MCAHCFPCAMENTTANCAQFLGTKTENIHVHVHVCAMIAWTMIVQLFLLILKQKTGAETYLWEVLRRLQDILLFAIGRILLGFIGDHELRLKRVPAVMLKHGDRLILPKADCFDGKYTMYFHFGIFDKTNDRVIAFTHKSMDVPPESDLARDQCDGNSSRENTSGSTDDIFTRFIRAFRRYGALAILHTASVAMDEFGTTRDFQIVHQRLDDFYVDADLKYVVRYEDQQMHLRGCRLQKDDALPTRSPEEAVEFARLFAELSKGRAFGAYVFPNWNCESFVNCCYTMKPEVTLSTIRYEFDKNCNQSGVFGKEWLRKRCDPICAQVNHIESCGYCVAFTNIVYDD
eukprot:scpid82906/ scgid3063/ 